MFIGPFFYKTFFNSNHSDTLTPNEVQIIYSDRDTNTSVHNIKFRQLTAKCNHNPPRVNDIITIEFEMQNISDKPIAFLETFVAARNQLHDNKDFGYSNQGTTFQPQEIIKIEARINVDLPGTWTFWPCYALDIPDIIEEDNLCPGEWRLFPVHVAE